jgi:hypothetical protein
VDVQPKPLPRVRLLNTGHVNTKDRGDARSVAVAVAARRSRRVSDASLEDDTVVLLSSRPVLLQISAPADAGIRGGTRSRSTSTSTSTGPAPSR